MTRIYALTKDFAQMQQQINNLQASGGGDAPEAVYQGLQDACNQIKWRSYSSRLIILVGDAPPHGFANWLKTITNQSYSKINDHWPNSCPSGLDAYQVAANAEKQPIKIYAISMTKDTLTQEA